MTKKPLPERTVERLSEYRRTLLRSMRNNITHVYSHNLASIHGITAVQVRRDLMLIGFSSDTKKGYNVKELAQFISNILEGESSQKVAIIGMGNLASAITAYFNGKRNKLSIVAAFDVDSQKVGTEVAGVPCYHVDEFGAKASELGISIVMLTTPASTVDTFIEELAASDIRGVLNFTSAPLNFPDSAGIYVEDYDIITLLEKVAYYARA